MWRFGSSRPRTATAGIPGCLFCIPVEAVLNTDLWHLRAQHRIHGFLGTDLPDNPDLEMRIAAADPDDVPTPLSSAAPVPRDRHLDGRPAGHPDRGCGPAGRLHA